MHRNFNVTKPNNNEKIRKFQQERSPTLIAVLDTNDQLYGALISENIR